MHTLCVCVFSDSQGCCLLALNGKGLKKASNSTASSQWKGKLSFLKGFELYFPVVMTLLQHEGIVWLCTTH